MTPSRPRTPARAFPGTEPGQLPGLVNYEAEQALLGAILTRNEIWFEAAAVVRGEHFADALHGRIFEAVGRMVKASETANAVTLKAEFENDPALVGQGGAPYLARLAASVVTLLNAGQDYGDVIRDLWQRRQLIAEADDLRSAAADPDRPADELLTSMLGELTALSGEGRQTAISKRAVAESLVEGIMKPSPCYSTGIESLDESIGGHSSSLAAEIERFCGDHDFSPRLGHRCSQVATVKALVALNMGISILPRIVRRPADDQTLVYRELTGRVPTREVAIVRHLQRYQTKGAELFLKVLRAFVAQLSAPSNAQASPAEKP